MTGRLRAKAAAPVGIGVVGAGRIGQLAHLSGFAAHESCRVVALADLRPRLRAMVAETFGVAKTYASHRDLLADPAVDAVCVVTRSAATGPVVLDAVRAGKHVLSEKPMAHTVEQAETIRDAVRAAGVGYTVGFMKRHDPGVRWAKAAHDGIVARGALGPVQMVTAYCHEGADGCPPGGFAMTDEARPDGLEVWPTAPAWLDAAWHADYAHFVNVNVHMVNLLAYFFEDRPAIEWVNAAHPKRQIVGLDFGAFPGVLTASPKAGAEWCEGLEIEYERGRLVVELPPPLTPGRAARVTVVREGDVERWDGPVPAWSFASQAGAFVSGLIAGVPAETGADEGVADMAVVEAIWRRATARGAAPRRPA